MKLRIFCLWKLIAFVGLILTMSCHPPGDSHATSINTVRPSPTESPVRIPDEKRLTRIGTTDGSLSGDNPAATVNTGEPDIFDCLSGGGDFVAGGIKIVSTKFRGKESLQYPQIDSPRTPQQRKFNTDVLNVVRRDLAGSGDEGDYSVTFATPEFVSVMLWVEFCGASCHVGEIAFNYDLKTGKRINELSQLFKPKSDYLTKIASYCVAEFKRCGWGKEDDWFKKGTKPTADNYEIWTLTRDGVAITFPEYQIAPGVFPGATVVVPYSHLKGMLRQDVNWFRRLPH